jgi:hypothetical protein
VVMAVVLDLAVVVVPVCLYQNHQSMCLIDLHSHMVHLISLGHY